MGYKGDSCMDCGYFMGTGGGLLWIPPSVPGQPTPPSEIIPWDAFDENGRLKNVESDEDDPPCNEVIIEQENDGYKRH